MISYTFCNMSTMDLVQIIAINLEISSYNGYSYTRYLFNLIVLLSLDRWRMNLTDTLQCRTHIRIYSDNQIFIFKWKYWIFKTLLAIFLSCDPVSYLKLLTKNVLLVHGTKRASEHLLRCMGPKKCSKFIHPQSRPS